MANCRQLRTAPDESSNAEGNEEEPARGLQETMSAADIDAGAECRSVVYNFPDSDAVRIGDCSHGRFFVSDKLRLL